MHSSPTWRDKTGRLWMLTVYLSGDRTNDVYLVSGTDQQELDCQRDAPVLLPHSMDVYDQTPDEQIKGGLKFYLGQGRGDLGAFIDHAKFKRVATLKGLELVAQ